MGLYERLLKEITEQKWLYNAELVNFQKFNETQYLLVNQANKILRVVDRIVSFNISEEEIEVWFLYDSDDGCVECFILKNLDPATQWLKDAKID